MREGRFFLPSAIFLLVASALASGQGRETVLYSFGTNANDGSIPNGGLVFDAAGNLYGTTQRGGANAGGVVFELTPVEGGGWSETVLYNFCAETNCADGGLPLAGLILDSAGNLYGTTAVGGAYSGGTCRAAGCGTVFELSPPAATGGAWTELVLWNFKGDLNNDGSEPASRLNRDADGNLYGTTMSGGNANALGTVFELIPISGGSWSEGVLYVFCQNGPPCPDGVFPDAGVSFDAIGNLYGTTLQGGVDDQWGTVYMLSPRTGGYWAETTLYQFTPQSGGNPHSVVNFDPAGNLYGNSLRRWPRVWRRMEADAWRARRQSGQIAVRRLGGERLQPACRRLHGQQNQLGVRHNLRRGRLRRRCRVQNIRRETNGHL
jgi:uncharacterized repeat protein (TIGR03803 family)